MYQLSAYAGPWSAETRAHPALAWLEAYLDNVRGLGLSDPRNQWYASSSVYFNCDGKIIRGGDHIWQWIIEDVFGSFDEIKVADEQTRVRIVHKGAAAFFEDADLKTKAPQDADVILYEHVLLLTPRDPKLKHDGPVAVRRMTEWIIGKSENGLGWGGLQCWQGKVCWDTSVVRDELARRIKLNERRTMSFQQLMDGDDFQDPVFRM